MSKRQRKFPTNDEQMYASGVHLSHVDVSGNACTALANARQHAFGQTHSLLFGQHSLNVYAALEYVV